MNLKNIVLRVHNKNTKGFFIINSWLHEPIFQVFHHKITQKS